VPLLVFPDGKATSNPSIAKVKRKRAALSGWRTVVLAAFAG
jgi:hypothetical protein